MLNEALYEKLKTRLLRYFGTKFLKSNGYTPLSGALESEVTTGTAPFIIASTTKVDNLNVDKVDGYDLDQAVGSGSSPTLDGSNFTNIDADDVNIADAGTIITATDVEGALQENRTAIDLNTTHRTSNGSDHSYIDQDVTSGSSPTLDGANISGVEKEHTITVEEPSSSEDIGLWKTEKAITITHIYAVMVGSSPSVTWTIRFNSDRSATGTEVVTGGTTTTSTTTGDDVTSFDDATIPAGSWIWLETTAQSGTVDQMTITIRYDEDA